MIRDQGITRILETIGAVVTSQPLSKKQTVITELYAQCKARGDLEFNNDEVKAVCARVGFGNPFDVTKVDNSGILPKALSDDDVFVVHLGRGRHKFVSGISVGYHAFESIPEERQYQWPYHRNILDEINSSRRNSLWFAYNQGIMSDFLYADSNESPYIRFNELIQVPLDFRLGTQAVKATRFPAKLAFLAEKHGHITVFEVGHGEPTDFNVFRLFSPFQLYWSSTQKLPSSVTNGCYVLRHGNRLRLYLYEFSDPRNPGSIRLLRNAEYALEAD